MDNDTQGLLPLLSSSRMRLVTLLKRHGTITVQFATEELGLAETTIRQHLDRLADAGIIESEAVSEGRGRPTLHYRLSPAGERLFPSQSSEMLGTLLRFLVREGYPELVDRFFREMWDARQATVEERLRMSSASTLPERLDVLIAFLAEQGFAPEVRLEDTKVTLRECNCPLSAGVDATRLPCRLESAFLEHVIGHELTRVTYIPDGHPACTYEFSIGPAPGQCDDGA
jgi:predicted ArsR family transcriptional regulator